MKIESFRVFEGRNIYSHRKCIKMLVDLQGYTDIPTKDIKGFNEKLLKIIPSLNEHRCGIDEDNGFKKRLYEGTYIAHVCEHIIIAIENLLGIDAAYGKSREISGDKYYIIYEYLYKDTAIEIGKMSVRLVNSLIYNKIFDFDKEFSIIREILKREELGPSTLSIVKEVKKRNIPVIKLGDGSMFQLGYGKCSNIIEATIGYNTKAVSVDIACDKLLTKEMLYNQCLPVARGGIIKNPIELLFKAEDIGYPVVLKPRYGNQGKGVFVNIKNEKELIKAYNMLSKRFNDVIMEKNIIGRDYRICVVNGKVVAAAERIPPYVIGDGKRSIKKLIEEINDDVRRGDGHEKPLTKIRLNEELKAYIGKHGYDLDTILNKDKKLILRENANLSTGGKSVDCTDIMCRENIEICERAAKSIGLDICGIDICCTDISKPMDKSSAIIEINAAPGIRMHHYPSEGKSRNVAGSIVDMMFDEYKSMPIVSVTGTNGKTTTTRLIGYTLSLAGYNVGMTTTGGIYVNDKCIDKGDTTGYDSAITILTNKEVDAAVLETARGGIIRRGLAYDLADVGVITNITEDHLGIDNINTIEDLAYVKALIGEAVKYNGYAVINADDPYSLKIIDRIKSSIIMFSKYRDNKVLRKNIEKGGYGVYVHEGIMYAEKDNKAFPILRVEDISISIGGKLIYNIENAMAACSALIGLGINYSIIRQGLSKFCGDEKQNPGRFNIYDINGVKVVLDYGHNIEGYKAVLKGASAIKHNKLIGVIGVPGDRTGSSVEEVGKISSQKFDYIYIKEDKDRRGRKPGEIAKLLEKGILSTGFDRTKIKKILNEVEALDKAIDNAVTGDLIIIFFEELGPLRQLIKSKINNYNKKDSSMAMV